METLSYISGSGILTNPNAVLSFLLLLLACLSAWIACKELDNSSGSRNCQMFFLSALCLLYILAGFFILSEGTEMQRMRKSPVEKMEFENHDYLLFRDRGVIHDPACTCRKPFMKNAYLYKQR